MRVWTLLLAMFIACSLSGQDKIYFLDGSTKICRVNLITSEAVEITETEGYEYTISRELILLVQYKNGSVEVFNQPTDNLVKDPNDQTNSAAKKRKPESLSFKRSYASLNTLALVNADISAFYEYRHPKLPFSFGVMGAYNFNLRCTVQNAFIAILSNAKKNYDIGALINYYPGAPKENKVNMYLGLMMKYTDFSFDIVTVDSVQVPAGYSQVLSFRKTRGSQLSTMGVIGVQAFLRENFFIKTFLGLGAFKLRGDYKEQFLREVNKNLEPGQTPQDGSLLPKAYLGINVGFNF